MEGRMQQRAARTEGGGNLVRGFALVVGLVYLAVGVLGFLETGFGNNVVANTGSAILGFDLNIFHNLVHVAVGLGLIITSRLRDVAVIQGVLIGAGLFYIVAALLGFINDYTLRIISIDDQLAPDNFLHLFSGAAALIVGLIGVRQHEDMRFEDEEFTPAGMPVTAGGPAPLEERRSLWDTDETYREDTYGRRGGG